MTKKMLTEERVPTFTIVEDITQYDEAGKAKLPPGVIQQVRFRAGRAGHVTANGRLYSKKLMKREITRIQPLLQRRAVKVLSGHPEQGKSPDPEREIGVLTGLSMTENGTDDGEMIASMDVFPTTAGNNFSAKTRARSEVGFSSRGPGTATPVKFTDQHEDYCEDNKEWLGKEIEMVNEDYRLITFDHVLGQAVEDAVGLDYHESKKETEEMELDINKLTDEQWEAILGSEKGKGMISEAVEKAVEKITDEVVQTEATKHIEKFINENFDIIEDEDSDEEDIEEAKSECPECGAKIGKASKFCPSCGLKVAKMEAKTPDEKDEEIAKLKKENEERDAILAEMAEKLIEMEQDAKDREEAEEVGEILAECLKGKPEAIMSDVLDRLENADINPENVKELVESAIVKVEAFTKSVGGELTESISRVPVRNGDEDEEAIINESEDQAVLDNMLED